MRKSGLVNKLFKKAEWSVVNYLWQFKPIRYTFIALALFFFVWPLVGLYFGVSR